MKKFSWFLSVLVVLVSCSKNEPVSIDKPEDPYFVSVAEAKAELNAFLAGFGQKGTRTATRVATDDVEMVYATTTTRGAEETPMFYAIDLADHQGFALVSTDARTEPIWAVTDTGSYDPQTDNPGYKLFMERAEILRRQQIEQADSIVAAGGSLETPQTRGMIWIGGSGYDETVPPLLTTTWGQGYPYNAECFTPSGAQAKAGCVPIAIAQVCAYYRYPTWYGWGSNYDWDAILQGPTVDPANLSSVDIVGSIVRDIGGLVGAIYGIVDTRAYTADSPSVFRAFDYFRPGMYFYYNFERIKSNLQGYHPVIVRGVNTNAIIGHTWVIDGLAMPMPYMIDPQTGAHIPFGNWYVHCNWGWDGDDNGYFLEGVFNVAGQSYNSDISMVVDISRL